MDSSLEKHENMNKTDGKSRKLRLRIREGKAKLRAIMKEKKIEYEDIKVALQGPHTEANLKALFKQFGLDFVIDVWEEYVVAFIEVTDQNIPFIEVGFGETTEMAVQEVIQKSFEELEEMILNK